MPLSRLIYISENQIDPLQGSVIRQLNSILSASNRHNSVADITGALVFDDMWFLQVLEGERKNIWTKFEHIKDDPRHANVQLIEVVEIRERLFGNWWMGLARRSPDTEHLFAPFIRANVFQADMMTAADILGLVREMAKLGLRRDIGAETVG